MSPAPALTAERPRHLRARALQSSERNDFLRLHGYPPDPLFPEPFAVDLGPWNRGLIEIDLSGIVAVDRQESVLTLVAMPPSGEKRFVSAAWSGKSLCLEAMDFPPEVMKFAAIELAALPELERKMVQAEGIMLRYRDTLHALAQ